MAQNEMRAMRGMPLRVRSMEGLGVTAWHNAWDGCNCRAQGCEGPQERVCSCRCSALAERAIRSRRQAPLTDQVVLALARANAGTIR